MRKPRRLIEFVKLQQYAPRTEEHYIRMAKKFFRYYNDVTQETLDSFLTKNVKSNTLTRAFCALMIECFKLKNIKIHKPRMRVGERLYTFLSKRDIDYLIARTSPKTSLMIQLYFETGLRLIELINMKRENINLESRYLSGVGKGNKPFKEKFGKNSRMRLVVFLNESHGQIHNPDFPFHYPKIKNQGKKFWYELRKECDQLGYKNVHPHRIRHSLGHHLRADLGFDLEQIRLKLRHTKLETTKIYTTATREEVERKMEESVFR